VSNQVNLSSGYDMAAPGQYHVEFTGRIHDVVAEERLIPRKARETNTPVTISGNVVMFAREPR
jgi:hypothetical protein